MGIGRRAFVAVMLAAAVCAPSASASDGAATQAYLQADAALVHAATARLPRFEQAPREVLAQVRAQCPLDGHGSPQNADSTKMSDEVIGAMVLSAYREDLPALAAFTRAVSGLRWSSGSINREVRAYVAHLRTLSSLHVPQLCADVSAWRTGGYAALPAATTRFVSAFLPAWVAIGDIPPGLSAFESGTGRSLASRTARSEELLADAEARAVETWGSIMTTLELWP